MLLPSGAISMNFWRTFSYQLDSLMYVYVLNIWLHLSFSHISRVVSFTFIWKCPVVCCGIVSSACIERVPPPPNPNCRPWNPKHSLPLNWCFLSINWVFKHWTTFSFFSFATTSSFQLWPEAFGHWFGLGLMSSAWIALHSAYQFNETKSILFSL